MLRPIFSFKTYALIAICICSLHLSSSAQSLNIPLITINESEVAYAPVDEIHFTLDIYTHDLQIVEARNKNKKIAQAVFLYLDQQGVDKRYIQTKRMQISKNYIRNSRDKSYDGFNAYQHVYVCLKDINSYDKILDALLSMDVGTVTGPVLKSSKYDAVLKKAEINAVKKARKNAQDLAAALGQHIGKAKLIKTTIKYSGGNSAYTSGNNTASSAQANGSSFEIGEIEIISSVEVAFELLD